MSDYDLAINYIAWAAVGVSFFASAAWAIRAGVIADAKSAEERARAYAIEAKAREATQAAKYNAFTELIKAYGSKVSLTDLKKQAADMGLVDLVETGSEDAEHAE